MIFDRSYSGILHVLKKDVTMVVRSNDQEKKDGGKDLRNIY